MSNASASPRRRLRTVFRRRAAPPTRRLGPDDALHASVRRRWEAIDWEPAIPDTFVIPEAHYMAMEGLGLTHAQRVGLNRLFACFTCELFVHFEAYVIEYLEQHRGRVGFLSDDVVERFVAEERVHARMFRRLLGKLRPDLYRGDSAALRFLHWRRSDEFALSVSPPGTFFVLAWLFEEITLFVPPALEAVPEQSAALVHEVMRLHAHEELPHVAIDARVIAHLRSRDRRAVAALSTTFALPILAFVDHRVRRAWRRLVAHATTELGLTVAQARTLRDRGPSQSDVWGMQSFKRKIEAASVPGGRLLCLALPS